MTIDVPLRAESWGPTTVSLLHQTVGENFSRQVKRSPGRIAIVAGTRRVSYQELDELSDALAQGFLTLGLRRSDRVAVSLGNCIEYGVILYACLKIGAIVVPLNPAYTLAQLTSALDHVSASLLVLSTEITLPYRNPKATAPLVSQLLDHISPSSSLQHLLLLDNSDGRSDIPFFESTVDYEVLLEQHLGTKLLQQHGLDAGNVATIQFTSGTTSKPKAVCLTHRNILNNACLVGQGMCLTENDVICCPPPLYHCFGLVLGLLAAMTHGASLLFPSESFNAEATLKAIVQHSATALYGVPTMFLAELELISKGLFTASNFGTLRTGVIGGSPIPPALRLQLHEKMNLSGLTNCYGLTESSPIVVQTDVHDTLDTKMSSVGRVLPHSAIRIAARDNPCQTLYRGEKGEIQIAGYAVMHGYWESEEETRKAVIQVGDTSWLRTGDEGLMASDGTIQITGRIKDIIIRGGENIYPAEIEDCLLKHEQVSCASVVGLPDPRYGETIAAFIQHREGVTVCIGDHDKDFSADLRATATVSSTTSTLTAGQIRDWVRDTLGKSLVPRHVFWVSSMPLTTSGKIEKFRLQEMGVIHLNSRR
ncbi:putative NRPS-like protein biosynthetic cluster [Aspergillus puulaauensis]|uniref:Putative NRPS-like protein biosynthetic cluster n=1 Tax=Aspergillus puulaauensis TaxID=1220207 RepID=A0A7R7XVE3_9EURO|nr:putative NRPS-like protein biosynthetic cluster [Aspergillus puulaauensis]BCS28415.1 putative NRPS-like protein biosynthetic cluster [Aspergillus puulaauensis]